jgi:hypothetical protein
MSSIKLKHSGGNGVIIAAPSSNPASDRTLTLPGDADGTILTSNSALGKILNVTSVINTTSVTINATTTFTDTGLTHSITTSAANSKILMLGRLAFDTARNNNDAGARFKILRTISGSTSSFLTDTDLGEGVYMTHGSHTRFYGTLPIAHLDSPNQAAGTAISFKMQARTNNTNLSEDVRINKSGRSSNIILLEVAA